MPKGGPRGLGGSGVGSAQRGHGGCQVRVIVKDRVADREALVNRVKEVKVTKVCSPGAPGHRRVIVRGIKCSVQRGEKH